MAVSIRLTEEETKLIKSYATIQGTTVSDVIRRAIMEKIEHEFDIYTYEQALKQHEEQPTTFTLAEVKALFDIE